MVVWKSGKAYYTGRLSGGAWRSRRLAEGGRLAGAQVEAAVDGSATFVWTSQRELQSAHQSSSGVVADEVVVSALGPRYSSATLVSDDRDNVLVFWTAASQIFVARSDVREPAWSEPSDINKDYFGVDAYGQIAASLAADGSVLIVWHDLNKMQDGVDGTLARRGVGAGDPATLRGGPTSQRDRRIPRSACRGLALHLPECSSGPTRIRACVPRSPSPRPGPRTRRFAVIAKAA